MNRKIIIKIAAIISLAFILSLIGLSVYFALSGNGEAFFSVISLNAFFVIVIYFLLRFEKSSRRGVEDANKNDL